VKSISYYKFADRFLAYTHRGKYILVSYDRRIWLPAFSIYFFSRSFVDTFWCHPTTCCEDKGIEWT